MIIGVDVDGVIADLHREWLRLYNRDFNDDLTVQEVTHWDIDRFVKPECGKRIFDYLNQPTLYDGVEPFEGALLGVLALRDLGHRTVFVSSGVIGSYDGKHRWLERHGFLPTSYSHKDLVYMRDKSLFGGAALIDDYHENLKNFNGIRLLVDTPYNQGDQPALRVHDWQEIVHTIGQFATIGTRP